MQTILIGLPSRIDVERPRGLGAKNRRLATIGGLHLGCTLETGYLGVLLENEGPGKLTQ
jgi:hypothetical protein